MLKRKKKNQKTRNRLILIGFVLIAICSFIRLTRGSQSLSSLSQTWSQNTDIQTGEAQLLPAEKAILEGEMITGDLQLQNEMSISESETWTWLGLGNQTFTSFSGSGNSESIQAASETLKKPQKSDLFPVSLCNQIVDFYECIIQKAPIENQPVMQKNLKQATETWHLMASSQLTEICQKINQDQTFLLVKQHYATGEVSCVF